MDQALILCRFCKNEILNSFIIKIQTHLLCQNTFKNIRSDSIKVCTIN